MIKKKMNITSGECLNEILTKKYLDEVFVPFNEAMIKGTYSYPLFSHEFLQERANVHQVSIEEYKSKLEGFLNLLHNLKQIEKVVLWFGDELFCQENRKIVIATLNYYHYKGKLILNIVNEENGDIINTQIISMLNNESLLTRKDVNKMKYCSVCGAQVNSENRFCQECGASVDEHPITDTKTQQENSTLTFAEIINTDRVEKNQMGKVTEPDPGLTMLAEYCTKTVATVGGDGYTEWVLYKREDNSLQLDYFSNYVGYENEIHSSHSVTNETWDKINQIKEQYDLNKPTLENMPSMCGGVQLVKIVENDKVYRLEYGKLTKKQNEGFWLIKDLLTTI